MARPRDPNIPTETACCPVHGIVEMRLHHNGVRADGSIRYRRRCPDCHAEEALHRYHNGPTPTHQPYNTLEVSA